MLIPFTVYIYLSISVQASRVHPYIVDSLDSFAFSSYHIFSCD